ncbi:MAG: ABC transporter permease, partial [Kiritimatiellae bacterium]|nr:ABC transporter permease [Kiritimatiellia bacterium]MDW8457866.1 ABC transporter permease [Verrucomicrobiota bacterium]
MRPLRETIRLITLAIRVASRDLRAQSSGFVWYALALGLGMGAMMAISSFRDHMADAYRARAKALLGADLAIRTRRALSETARSVLAQVPGRFADEVQFRTMAWFPESERARFVQVRAIGPGYPFFGAIETEPPDAAHTLHEGPHALVEENALIQSGGGIGSRVRVGSREFIVSGILRRAPGESPSEALIAPRIYIAHDRTGETGLLQPGSIVSYRRYFALPSGSDPEAWADRLRNELAAERPEVETAASRARALLGASDPIARYLGLVGFAALLLGSAGSAAAARLYLTRRIQTLAMIKCIGAPVGFAEAVFVAQILALCATGVLAGVFLSLVVLPAISTWMQGVLAVEVNASLRPGAVAEAGAAGAIFCMGFAALPLDSVRRLSPAQALRHGFELAPIRASAPARFITALGLAAAAALFTVWQTGSWARGLGIASAAAAGCIALGLVARALRVGARSLSGRLKWTAARHALAGMDRPYSSAGLLMIVLGAGSALLALLLVAEHSLRRVLSVYREPDQPTI